MTEFRQYYEELEKKILSPYAALSSESKGRMHPMEKCPLRTEFQRDRDRILHCKSFRRLKHKTQVFLQPEGDHYRTRLTHTLEVSQIARTICRALRLNEDLAEAIALGHDLGHTPFGHKGEDVLNKIAKCGFEHNEQSLRVVDILEAGGGLNLTFEVRDGILNHKKDGKPSTLEGVAVSYADRIAYINHDIDDAIRAGVLGPEKLPKRCIRILGDSHGRRINTMIFDIAEKSFDKPAIGMSARIEEATEELRDFMFENVYLNPLAKSEEGKVAALVEGLFDHFMKNPDAMPEEYGKHISQYGCERVVCDYIAGMTDRYAIRIFEGLFVPESWRGL
ncbi:MAG: deoxyguanosinetriphosphate triphosphohydrolase [Bacillota bacterium]|nr:deoxyguanosinetriphosphate triphosphohydrolase [Bacillota bacterium]